MEGKALSLRRTRISAPKVKTGCKTCKARKIKCDEGRPACTRCVRFGIQCDGYAPMPLTKAQKTALLRQQDALKASSGVVVKRRAIERAPDTQVFGSDREYRYFQKFSTETAVQLTGAFDTDLWKRVVLQTSQTEPAIRHAVIAIGSLNLESRLIGREETDTLRCEFAYREYGLAIAEMRKRTAERPADIRTKLLACILFACFEAYHGDTAAASNQTFAGVEMMNEYLEARERARDNTSSVAVLLPPPIDLDITQTLLTLEVQSCGYSDRRSTDFHLKRMSAWQSAIEEMPYEFKTLQQARLVLTYVMLRGIHFCQVTHREDFVRAALFDGPSHVDPHYAQLCSHFAEFHKWHAAFAPLLRKARMPHGKAKLKAATFMELHYLSSYLWLATGAPEPMFYRRYTPELKEIVRLVKSILRSSPDDSEPNFSLDMRLVMCLSTVGLRYRHRALRQEVIEILSNNECPSRDGVWDGKTIAQVMYFVAEMEEDGLLCDEEYVPEEFASTICDLRNDIADRYTYVKVWLPSKTIPGDAEYRERYIEW